ncbi:hypothetical protein AS156_14240 [Bradyrhizobium macuxiense]|uniref:Uncharacterized protein n=1 Tax=Bradyrhizobium macuxiense TaxID=1755647 RepID=A0A120FKC6_9BRAD|nr:hypothetical protein [Bradyrhizobium macuxiense]KWV50481.1 hypothetical protein AS156_14240 [Bradyrhizobium macuxiense]
MTKTVDIVAALGQMQGLTIEQMFARLGEQFPDAGLDQIEAAFKIAASDADETARRLQREAAALEGMGELLDGMPKGTTVRQAAEIKAKRGDQLAIAFLAHINSPEVRIGEALWRAACEADPRWSKRGEGAYAWKGKGEPPSGEMMIEWFQTTHPTEARRIEAEVGG